MVSTQLQITTDLLHWCFYGDALWYPIEKATQKTILTEQYMWVDNNNLLNRPALSIHMIKSQSLEEKKQQQYCGTGIPYFTIHTYSSGQKKFPFPFHLHGNKKHVNPF